LRSHINDRISSEYLVDTLFDLSSIKVTNRKGYSLLEHELPNKIRYVISGTKIIDYDELPDDSIQNNPKFWIDGSAR